jgi:hypothetical protein
MPGVLLGAAARGVVSSGARIESQRAASTPRAARETTTGKSGCATQAASLNDILHSQNRNDRPQMRLQRLAQELLRHFGRWPPGAAAAQHPAGGGAAGAQQQDLEWQVLLFPDQAAHGQLKNTSWGPTYPHDVTVSVVQNWG